jgi:uncharacterized membrane protein YdjX (TVP38/TMEM64 family)
MQGNDSERERRNLILGSGILAAAVAIIAALTITGHLQHFFKMLWEIFQTKEALRVYLESWGVWAPIVFVILQALQVVIAPIPGELTGIVGGFVFGGLVSIVYSTIGLTIGSLIAFAAARLIGLPFVKLVISEGTLEKFHFVAEPRGIIASLVLFVIPGFPKDILCYILGLSPMGYLTFLTVCGLGRIPGTVMLSFSGAAIYEEDSRLLIVVAITALVCIGIFYFKKERAALWLRGGSQIRN